MERPPRRPSAARPRPRSLQRAAAALFLAILVALPFAVLYRGPVSRSLHDSWEWDPLPSLDASEEDGAARDDDLDSQDLKLEQVLQKASMGDNTVILTTLNSAWASPGSVIDLFIDSFRSGVRTSSLLNHLVIIAFDWNAYKQCLKIHPYCFALGTDGVDFSEEKRFLTSGYLEMMWKRIDFLRLVLESGFSFIFSIACDHYFGNATDLRNIANGGFNYVKSNERSIEFYSFWYSSRLRYPGLHDQDVFNVIKHDPYVSDIGLKIKFLSTSYFGGFCEPSRDLNKVCTMHANCCIGLQSKSYDGRLEELFVLTSKLEKIECIGMEGAAKLQPFLVTPIKRPYGQQKEMKMVKPAESALPSPRKNLQLNI
uniref:Nucleotide-diphospho-sugar transferase domain-containing protein n=1 Tax=Oryza rufipogon TaxID=4529 RepID=A0A0E0PD95_ORYRU